MKTVIHLLFPLFFDDISFHKMSRKFHIIYWKWPLNSLNVFAINIYFKNFSNFYDLFDDIFIRNPQRGVNLFLTAQNILLINLKNSIILLMYFVHYHKFSSKFRKIKFSTIMLDDKATKNVGDFLKKVLLIVNYDS